MTRLTVIVEGPTEERFIKDVLAPSLWVANIHPTPIIVGAIGHKGGNVNYARVRKDVLLQLKQDPNVYCSSMLDLYRLGSGFPGTPFAENMTGRQRAERIEAAVLEDIVTHAAHLRPDLRLIPYLQVHEYEALLFSDSNALNAAGMPAFPCLGVPTGITASFSLKRILVAPPPEYLGCCANPRAECS